MAVVVFTLGVIVGMAVLTFAFDNMQPVTLRYPFTGQTQPIPLFSVIMAAVGVGFAVASLFGFAAYLRQRRTIRQQVHLVAELQAEVHTLRTLPLDAPQGTTIGAAVDAKPPETTGELSPR